MNIHQVNVRSCLVGLKTLDAEPGVFHKARMEDAVHHGSRDAADFHAPLRGRDADVKAAPPVDVPRLDSLATEENLYNMFG